jgi:tryptophanyl-tRNA synthetase
MSKSRGNGIPLSATADETARIIRSAVTDSDPCIGYDPVNRPGVSGLLQLAGLCLGKDPAQVAAGLHGAARLKATVTEAVNEFFAPVRARRAALASEPGYLRQVLLEGNERATAMGDATLAEVRAAMGMVYAGAATSR